MKLKSLLSVLALLVAAKASAISYTAISDGTSVDNATVSAVGGTATIGSAKGVTFLGVSGGAANDEIDANQKLVITFDTPQIFTYITVGLLFNGNEHGDVKEIAAFSTPSLFKLWATGDTTATYTDAASTVDNLSPATKVGGGIWKISNPFPGIAVTILEIYPLNHAGQGNNKSDFGLIAFETTKTPDVASTLGLAGLALLGLGFAARRK